MCGPLTKKLFMTDKADQNIYDNIYNFFFTIVLLVCFHVQRARKIIFHLYDFLKYVKNY